MKIGQPLKPPTVETRTDYADFYLPADSKDFVLLDEREKMRKSGAFLTFQICDFWKEYFLQWVLQSESELSDERNSGVKMQET